MSECRCVHKQRVSRLKIDFSRETEDLELSDKYSSMTTRFTRVNTTLPSVKRFRPLDT